MTMKNFVLLLTVVIGYVFGIYFYCRGFLLTRNSLLINSTCAEVQADNAESCWMKASFKKGIIIIIDALRYDFIAWQSNHENLSPYHHNKLNSVHDILINKSDHGILFKFVADPPTTTLQRLKALTTGSLPTFVDAGSNFAGSAIEEDNIIDQFRRRNTSLVLLGDDTWVSLFPLQFSKQFPYPSFDVKDLHTVDNGVLEHLFEELNNNQDSNENSVLIAHFLGVDHCGHKFGPNHPEMASKLTQLDDVLKTIMNRMKEDSVLFVLGDHGMTQTGDHGGDSADEIGAALFVYSPKILHNVKNNVRDAIVQVDLVPTISMLFDIPIPFSNLGAVIEELFPNSREKLHAARANVWQVVRYTENYLANYRDVVLSDRLQNVVKLFYSLEPEELTVEKCFDIIRQIGRIFVECWAKFHLGWMTLGILTIFETLLWSLSILLDHNRSLSGRKIFLKIMVFSLCSLVLLARNESIPPIVGVMLTCQVVLHLHTMFVNFMDFLYEGTYDVNWPMISSVAIIFGHGLSQFSNSYVVYDDMVCQYTCKSLFALLYWQNFVRNKKQISQQQQQSVVKNIGGEILIKTTRKKLTSKQLLDSRLNFKGVIYLIVALFLLNAGRWFNKCREEQTDCQVSTFLLPFASIFDDNWRFARIFLSVFSALFVFLAPRQFLQKNGALSGADTLLSVNCRFLVGGAFFSLLCFWLFQWIPENYTRQYASHFGPFSQAIFVYAFVFITLLSYLWDPLLCFYEKFDDSELLLNNRFANPRDAYQHIRRNWRQFFGPKINQSTIYMYGLASCCSCSFSVLLWSLVWLFLLLLGDGLAFSLVICLLIVVVALELNFEDSSPVVLLILLAELSGHFFYAFGHQTTFSSIPWDAAFVGVPGNFAYQFVQATLVVLHIGSSHLLAAFVIPLAVVWHLYRNKLGFLSFKTDKTDKKTTNVITDEDTELKLASNSDKLLENLAYYNLIYLSALAVKLLSIVVASALHRRHLMVWKIFAPKFIFEGVLFLVACCSIVVQYLLIYRFCVSLKRFLKRFG